MQLKKVNALLKASFVFAATVTSFFTSNANAGTEYFRFRNLNLGASWFDDQATFQQPIGGGQTVKIAYTSYNRGGWAGGMSMRTWRAGDLDFRGSRVNSRWRMTAGYVSSTARRAAPQFGQSPELTWSAWWVWTGQRNRDDNNQQEIDMVENIPEGNYWNHYWRARQGGDAFKNPNSLGWLNNWHRYASSFSTGPNVTFRRVTQAGVQTHSRFSAGVARNLGLQGRYSQRPWPFNNNRFGGYKPFRNFDVLDVWRQF